MSSNINKQKAIARITSKGSKNNYGTGFLISMDTVVTARHVIVENINNPQKIDIEFEYLEDEYSITKIVDESEEYDIAVLKLNKQITIIDYVTFASLSSINIDLCNPKILYRTLGYMKEDWANQSSFWCFINTISSDMWDLNLSICHQTNPFLSFKGMSGSPLYYNDKVIGIILEQVSSEKGVPLGATSTYKIKEFLKKNCINCIEYNDMETLNRSSIYVDNNKTIDIPSLNLKYLNLIEDQLSLRQYHELFKKGLVYFTDYETTTIMRLCKRLSDCGKAFLVGNPSSGKSIAALSITEEFKKQGFIVLYFSFKQLRIDLTMLYDEITKFMHMNVLCILDDCHLNMENVLKLYSNISKSGIKAYFLFISRVMPEMLQLFDKSTFDDIKECEFHWDTMDIEDKVMGIIGKYKSYLELENKVEYYIGEKKEIVKNVGGNLLVLSFYLQLWDENSERILSDIHESYFWKNIYEKYFKAIKFDYEELHRKKFGNETEETLLVYLCLYEFEISFESLPEFDSFTEFLVQQGIVLQDQKNSYSFYHSNFATLLLQAYEGTYPLFVRKYGSLNNLIYLHIKKYIMSFKSYRYPENLHTIFQNLVSNEKRGLFYRLSTDCELKEIISEFYVSRYRAGDFCFEILLYYWSIYSIDIFYELFNDFVIENEQLKTLYLKSKKSFYNFAVLLKNIQNNKILYKKIVDSFHESATLCKSSSLLHFGLGLREIYKYCNIDLSKAYLKTVSDSELLSKFENAKLWEFSSAINIFYKLDDNRIKNILEFQPDVWIKKANESSFIEICELLYQISRIDKVKATLLINNLKEVIQTKFVNAEFRYVTSGLYTIYHIDKMLAKELYSNMTSEELHNKIQEHNNSVIGIYIIDLYRIDPDRTRVIFKKIPNKLILEKMIKGGYKQITADLFIFKRIDVEKAKSIFKSIDDKVLTVPALKELKKDKAVQSLRNLLKIDYEKGISILKSFDELKIRESFKTAIIQNRLYEIDMKFYECISDGHLDKIEERLLIIADMINIKPLIDRHINFFIKRIECSKNKRYVPQLVKTIAGYSQEAAVILNQKFDLESLR